MASWIATHAPAAKSSSMTSLPGSASFATASLTSSARSNLTSSPTICSSLSFACDFGPRIERSPTLDHALICLAALTVRRAALSQPVLSALTFSACALKAEAPSSDTGAAVGSLSSFAAASPSFMALAKSTLAPSSAPSSSPSDALGAYSANSASYLSGFAAYPSAPKRKRSYPDWSALNAALTFCSASLRLRGPSELATALAWATSSSAAAHAAAALASASSAACFFFSLSVATESALASASTAFFRFCCAS